MRVKSLTPMLLPWALACAGTGGGANALSFQPRASEVLLTTADTVDISINAAGMGNLGIQALTTADLELSFDPSGNSTDVRVRYLDFQGEQTNPMGPPDRADLEDIQGELVLAVDERGRSTVVEEPEVSAIAARIANPRYLAQTIFPRLPARAVSPGDTWSDTVHVETEDAGWQVSATYVLDYTLRGDTVHGGETLLSITAEGDAEFYAAGDLGGFEIEQTLTGTVTEDILWHPVESALVFKRSTRDMTGELELPMMGLRGLTMRLTETSSTVRTPR